MKFYLIVIKNLLFLFLLACSGKVDNYPIGQNTFIIEPIEKMSDTVLVQGKQYKALLFYDDKYKGKYITNNEKVFLQIDVYFANGQANRSLIFDFLPEKGSSKLISYFTVPKDASYLYFAIINDNFYDPVYLKLDFPVYRQKGNGADLIMERNGVSRIIIKDTSKKEYLKSIEWEKAYYPENGLIYITKWNYEMSNQFLNRDSIEVDMDSISNSRFISSNQKNFISFIGFSLLNKPDSAAFYMNKIQNIEDPIIFNNEDVSNTLSSLRFISIFPDEILTPFFSCLMFNNPVSYFTKRQIRNGMIRNINTDTSNYIHSQILCSLDYSSVDLLSYTNLLLTGYRNYDNIKNPVKRNIQLKDSIEKASLILDSLVKYFVEPLTKQHLNFGSDNLFLKRQILFGNTMLAFRLKKDYNALIAKAFQILGKFTTIDNIQTTIYYEIGLGHYFLKNIDSAKKYLMISLALDPDMINSRNMLIKIGKEIEHIDYQDAYIDSCLLYVELPRYKLAPKAPSILFENEELFLNKAGGDKTIMLEFFTTTCQPCLQNIRLLHKYYSDLKGIEIILISPEEKDLVNGFFTKNHLNYKFVKNAFEILNYFNIHSFPETIVIDRNGYLIRRISGQYGDNFLSQMKSIK